jgi:hypothetical protein
VPRYPVIDFSNKPLYALQREILDDPHQFKAVAWGRQSGKSFTAKRGALEAAVNRGEFVVWISPSIPTAKEHWEDLKREIESIRFPHERKEQDRTLEFPSGGVIRIRTAVKPDNLRGMSPDLVILDEAAFFPDGEYVWNQVIVPMITASRGKVLLLSTPNGQNWFYEVWKRGQLKTDNYFRSWQAPSYVSPYQDRKLLEYLESTTHPRVWREEYLAEFLADGGGVFTNIDRQATSKLLTIPDYDQDYVAGIDWGMNMDYTVFTVLDKWAGRQVYGTRFTGLSPQEQIDKLEDLLDVWQPQKTYVETNGMGGPLWKMLKLAVTGQEEGPTTFDPLTARDDSVVRGRHTLLGVFMNNQKKRKIIDRLAAKIEFARLELLGPETEFGAVQISEMSTFTRKTSTSGTVQYEAAGEAHDDTIIALALAAQGLPMPTFKKSWTLKKKSLQNPFKVPRSLG